MTEYRKYLHAADMNRRAMYSLRYEHAISAGEKTRLDSACTKARVGTFGIQLPVIWGGMRLFDKYVGKLPWEKSFIFYVIGAQVYYTYFKLSQAFVWNNLFYSVEDIVKGYVEQMTEEQINQVRSEKLATLVDSKSKE
jgi:hypothetical protein